MDVSNITQLITSLGFPIVCVIAMAYAMWKVYTRSEDRNEQREDKLYKVISDAQAQNKELSDTNVKFVTILENYESDLAGIKTDITDIKNKLSKE